MLEVHAPPPQFAITQMIPKDYVLSTAQLITSLTQITAVVFYIAVPLTHLLTRQQEHVSQPAQVDTSDLL